MGVTDKAIKRVENYLDFEKLAHVNQHGLQDFSLKKSKRNKEESTETSHPSNILLPALSQSVTFP